jgi:hypothetical protein
VAFAPHIGFEDPRRRQAQQLLKAYMNVSGSVLADDNPGFFYEGGQADKFLRRAAGMAGEVGWQLSGGADVARIARSFRGDSEVAPGELPFQAGLRVNAGGDPAKGLRMLWNDPKFEPGVDTPRLREGAFDTGRMGEPLEAYGRPPQVESFLGDLWLRRHFNEKKRAVDEVADGDQARLEDLKTALRSYDEEIADRQMVGESYEDLLRDQEALSAEIDWLQGEIDRNPVSFGPDDYPDDLDHMQGALNNLWARKRKDQTSLIASGGLSQHEQQLLLRLLERRRMMGEAESVGNKSALNLGPLMNFGTKKRQTEMQIQALYKQAKQRGSRPAWHLPPKLTDRLNRPGTVRGGD